jgi:hypothetical protein
MPDCAEPQTRHWHKQGARPQVPPVARAAPGWLPHVGSAYCDYYCTGTELTSADRLPATNWIPPALMAIMLDAELFTT